MASSASIVSPLGWHGLKVSSGSDQEKANKPAAVSMEDVRGYLLGQDKKALVDMLVEHAMDDDRLRQRLFLKAAKKVRKRSISSPIRRPSRMPWKSTDS